jgi:hypothetical protein
VKAVPDDADSGLTKSDLTAAARRKWINRVTSDCLDLEGNGGMDYQKGREWTFLLLPLLYPLFPLFDSILLLPGCFVDYLSPFIVDTRGKVPPPETVPDNSDEEDLVPPPKRRRLARAIVEDGDDEGTLC